MRIAITCVVSLNVGDTAIMYGMIRTLKETFGDHISITIFDPKAEVASKYFPDLKFKKMMYHNVTDNKNKYLKRIFRPFQLFRFRVGLYLYLRKTRFLHRIWLKKSEIEGINEYLNSDLVISSGGTYLVENYIMKPKIFEYQLITRLKKPLVFFTQSLGPFRKPSNREYFKQLFDKAALVLLRDQKSYHNLLEIGVQNDNCYVVSDAAFALAENIKEVEKRSLLPHRTPLRVAISVREWAHFKKKNSDVGMNQYLTSIRDLCLHLVETYNAQVTFVSTCQGIREYWTDDSRIAAHIMNMLPKKYHSNAVLDSSFRNPSQLTSFLKEFDFVVSTRLHMAILATGVGVPVIPIAYEFKTQELFRTFELECLVLDIEDIDSKELIEKVKYLLDHMQEVRGKINHKVQLEKEKADGVSRFIKKAYENYAANDREARLECGKTEQARIGV